ncbi:MAG: hypothetical protein JXB50_15635 [Spirochaetes bacterium]|nr:hypothetical protein [Spirochaetota bacterium]
MALLTGVGIILWLLFIIIESIVSGIILRKKYLKEYITLNSFNKSIKFNLKDDLVYYKILELEIESEWSSIKKHYYQNKIILLKHYSKIFIIIPHRVLDEKNIDLLNKKLSIIIFDKTAVEKIKNNMKMRNMERL